MIDGISVLGTAVGVTSLGIQVCQALVRYYSDFRGFDEDIAAIITRAEGLEASLEALESIRPTIEASNSHISIQLQQAIETCSKGLAALKSMVEKCGEVEIPMSAQEKRRFWKKRIMYPFREETLRELRNKLDELQANVILALQILDIDTGRRHFDIIRSSADTLITRSDKLEHSILEQSKSLDNTQEYLRRIASGQEQEISQISQLSLQLATIENQLTSLIARDAPPKPTSLFLADEQHDETIHQSSTMKLEKWNHRKWCNCRLRKDAICWRKIGSSFEIKTVQETEHRQNCNFSQHGNSSYIFQAQFSRRTRIFGLCVQASIAIRKISGWTSISPSFSMRRLVRDTSPAFAVFFHVRCSLKCCCGYGIGIFYCNCGSPEIAPLILDSILSSIRRSIEEGRASPHDTSIIGDSILHMAFHLVLEMIRCGHIDTHTAWNFLRSLISNGICDYSADDLASEFVYEAFFRASSVDHKTLEKIADLSSLLISEFGSWSYKYVLLEPSSDSLMRQLLSYEHVLELYDYECPLIFAIHRRSKTDLMHEINMHKSVTRSGDRMCSKRDPCHRVSKLLSVSIHWPEGLRILLSSCLVRDDNNTDAWDSLKYNYLIDAVLYAVTSGNLETLNLLAHFGWPVYPAAWFIACCSPPGTHPPAFFARLLGAMLNWKVHQLDTPLRWSSPLGCGKTYTAFNLSTQAIWNHSLDNLYHSPQLSVALANILWEAGFKEVDNLGSFFNWACSIPSTPLWIKASTLYPPDYDVIEWFVRKGARLDWVQPVLYTTPAHRIALGFGKQAHFRQYRRYSMDGTSGARLLAKVLSMKHLDECFCYCSMGGCHVIGCAAKMLKDSLLHNAILPSGTQPLLDTIAKAIDSTYHQPNSLGLAVIRVLTFNELSLTHTCCTPLSEPTSDDRDKENRNIHTVEEKDINTLEDMMEEFKQSWNEHQGTFHDYLEVVWKVRMKKLWELDSDEPTSEHVEQIKSVGVLLWEPYGPKKLQDEYLHENSEVCESIPLDRNPDGIPISWRRRCCLGD